VDVQFDQADPEDYDALLLPGGIMNPDKLRMQPKAKQKTAAEAVDRTQPVAAHLQR